MPNSWITLNRIDRSGQRKNDWRTSWMATISTRTAATRKQVLTPVTAWKRTVWAVISLVRNAEAPNVAPCAGLIANRHIIALSTMDNTKASSHHTKPVTCNICLKLIFWNWNQSFLCVIFIIHSGRFVNNKWFW